MTSEKDQEPGNKDQNQGPRTKAKDQTMVDEKLRIIIEAVDKASGEISKVGKTFGSLTKITGVTAAAGLGAAAAATGAAATLMGKGLYYAAEQAMDAELVAAQLNAVLESTKGIAGVTAEAANELASSTEPGDALRR